MDRDQQYTQMIHYHCDTCGISATCVDTPSARLAWCDHMDNHAVKAGYGQWVWTVVPLPLD